jgi:hypothetical protein
LKHYFAAAARKCFTSHVKAAVAEIGSAAFDIAQVHTEDVLRG